jgi:hypothetical protein
LFPAISPQRCPLFLVPFSPGNLRVVFTLHWRPGRTRSRHLGYLGYSTGRAGKLGMMPGDG